MRKTDGLFLKVCDLLLFLLFNHGLQFLLFCREVMFCSHLFCL
jgi:hypothetical protein